MHTLSFVTIPNPNRPDDYHVSSEKPDGMEVDLEAGTWRFGDGLFTIGNSVRTTAGSRIMAGPLFVYDPANYQQRRKMRQIVTDLLKHGRLVLA